ncbi:unnamed protein product, partial [Didymodactylos carnosus]
YSNETIATVHLLSSSINVVFSLANDTIERCKQFTNGRTIVSLLDPLQSFFKEYLTELKRVVNNVRERHSKILGTEDWELFRQTIRILELCGDFILHYEQFESALAQQMLQIVNEWQRKTNKQKQDPFDFSVDLFLSKTNQQEFLSIITTFENADYSLFPDIPKLLSKFSDDCHRFAFDVVFLPINSLLNGFSKSPVWASENRGTIVTDLPSFSLVPQENITKVGQHLLMLPQHFEPFNLHDNRQLGAAFKKGKLPYLEDKDSYTDLTSYWLDAVAIGAMKICMDETLQIQVLSTNGLKQLTMDLNYLYSIFEDFGLKDIGSFRDLIQLLSAEDDEKFDEIAKNKPARMVTTIRSMRKFKGLGIVTPVDEENNEISSLAKDQIEQSRQRLTKLENDGLEFVTNVRVGQDLNEHQHRQQEEEATRKRNERLEQDAKSSKEKFEEIIRNWESARTKDIPRELHELLMDQKQACFTMLEQKNKLIGEFERELKNKDDHYVKMLKKFDEGIKLLVERMNEQIKSRRMYYAKELYSIEEAFIKERQELLEKYHKEWNEKLEERRFKEEQFVKARFERSDEFDRELQRLRVKQAEEFNATKLKLETQIQEQQRKIEEMKAVYQLSQEKYEYNYKVLKKRDEENMVTLGIQKTRKIKLTDILAGLKQKLNQKEKQFKTESIQTAEEYKRTLANIQEIKRKAKHFLTADLEKFQDLWIMNEEQCKDMAKKLLEADRIIFEQQLGLEWEQPDISFMDNVGPIDATKVPKSSIEVVKEILQASDVNMATGGGGIKMTGDQQGGRRVTIDTSTGAQEEGEEKTDGFEIKTGVQEAGYNLSNQSMKSILELICDEGEFLIEPKLLALLEPLDENQQSLIKLDAVFRALKIENEDDIKLMAKFFIDEVHIQEVSKKTYVSSGTGPEEDVEQPDEKTVVHHVELIHPNHVLKALKEFLKNYRNLKKMNSQAAYKVATLDDRDDSLDSEYWSKYANVIDERRERLWDSLLLGLQKYQYAYIIC